MVVRLPRRHPDKVLTAVKVKNLTRPGRHTDGNGLYLIVDPSGAKRWVLRTVVQGRRRDIGIGSARLVTLADARQKAADFRSVARDGGDPVASRRVAAGIPTFAEAAKKVHADRQRGWRNEKHKAQWLTAVERYVFPKLGKRPIDQIDTPEVLAVLMPIWLSKPETARRIKQRVAAVFDWAKASGYRTGDNPVAGVSKGLPKQIDRDRHHAAMPYASVPAFMQALRSEGGGVSARLALEFLILTAARTGEVVGARWNEIDLVQNLWTVSAGRMKAGREHRVPLNERSVAILKLAKEVSSTSPYVFLGQSEDKPMSNMAFLMLLRRMEVDVTVHGFRSAFRDWAAEQTNFPREVCEMALAHAIENKVEAAYRRGDLLEKRRELMKAWEKFACAEAGHTNA